MRAVAEPTEYYERFIMGRNSLKPEDFGIEMEKDDFADRVIEFLNARYRGEWSVDELLLHPRDAIRFCEDVRLQNQWYDLPDDFILRTILQRRKNPHG